MGVQCRFEFENLRKNEAKNQRGNWEGNWKDFRSDSFSILGSFASISPFYEASYSFSETFQLKFGLHTSFGRNSLDEEISDILYENILNLNPPTPRASSVSPLFKFINQVGLGELTTHIQLKFLLFQNEITIPFYGRHFFSPSEPDQKKYYKHYRENRDPNSKVSELPVEIKGGHLLKLKWTYKISNQYVGLIPEISYDQTLIKKQAVLKAKLIETGEIKVLEEFKDVSGSSFAFGLNSYINIGKRFQILFKGMYSFTDTVKFHFLRKKDELDTENSRTVYSPLDNLLSADSEEGAHLIGHYEAFWALSMRLSFYF